MNKICKNCNYESHFVYPNETEFILRFCPSCGEEYEEETKEAGGDIEENGCTVSYHTDGQEAWISNYKGDDFVFNNIACEKTYKRWETVANLIIKAVKELRRIKE